MTQAGHRGFCIHEPQTKVQGLILIYRSNGHWEAGEAAHNCLSCICEALGSVPSVTRHKKERESVDWKLLVVLVVDTDHSVIREAGSDPAPINQKVCGRCTKSK